MSSNPSVTLSCLHPHAAANEAVTLLEGAVTVPANGVDLQGTGALALRWLPSRGLRFDADLESGWNGPHPGARIRINIAGNDAETLVNSTNFGVKEGVSFSRISGSVSTFVKGSGNNLAHLGFQVLNFSDFLTPGPRPSSQFVEQAIPILERLLLAQGRTMADAVSQFPEHLRFGVTTAAARVLAARGLRHRRAQVALGNALVGRVISEDRAVLFPIVRQLIEDDREGWRTRLGQLDFERTLQDIS